MGYFSSLESEELVTPGEMSFEEAREEACHRIRLLAEEMIFHANPMFGIITDEQRKLLEDLEKLI